MFNRLTLLRIYLFISFLVLLNVILYLFDKISFVGYWSDRILFWIWIVVTCVVIITFWKKLWVKIYAAILVVIIILSMLPMGIFFWGMYLSGSGQGRLNHFNLDHDFRIQTVAYGILGRPRLQIVKDGVLFDKILLETNDDLVVNDSTSLNTRAAINAVLESETDSSVVIKYYFKKDTIEVNHKFGE